MSDWSKYGIHKGLFLWPSLWVLVAWLVFAFEHASGYSLSAFGLIPGSLESWYGPLTFPWLHGDVNHITSNTISLFFVGALIRYSFPKVFDKVWGYKFTCARHHFVVHRSTQRTHWCQCLALCSGGFRIL